MGLGDEIMVTGICRRIGRKVLVLDRNKQPRWNHLWRGNEFIARPGDEYDEIIQNGGSCRPYIDYKRTTKDRWFYTGWRAIPGYLPWVKPDKRGEGRIFLEPSIKAGASPNKQWGWENWQALAKLGKFSQIGPRHTKWLQGVERVVTQSFDEAVNVLATSDGAILPEGGLHHACAAIGIPAVVLFGAMTSPKNTGYDIHTNIWIDDKEALGGLKLNDRCQKAWSQITPEYVMTEWEKGRQMRNI